MAKKPINDLAKKQEEREIKEHLRNVGCADANSYVAWCKANNLNTNLIKTEPARKKERELYQDLKIKAAIQKGKEKHKPLGRKIEELLKDDKLDYLKVEDVYLRDILSQLSTVEKSEKKEYLEFISFLDKESKLLEDSAINRALLNVFKYRSKWIRPFSSWQNTTKNTHRQFSSLLRHLFAKYKMPEFLDNVWFWQGSTLYTQHIEWFLFIAAGNNIRKADKLPFVMTKAMAHEFLQSPAHYNMNQALRYGQIMGQGGDKRLVQMVCETQLGREFRNEDFWGTVIHLFIQNPMLDRNQVGPIVDYLNFQKFSLNAPQKGLTMKGRNPATLLDQVEAWHKNLRKVQGKNFKEWLPCGVAEFNKEEKSGDKSRVWNIIELKNSKELDQEGRAQSHCVGSYSHSCLAKRCAIYSIRLDGDRMATIEVIPATRSIVQARGKRNALVTGRTWQILQEWAVQARLNIVCSGGI